MGETSDIKKLPAKRLLRLVLLTYYLLTDPAFTSTEELEKCLSASRRTILRDLDLIRRAGLIVQFDHQEGHYRIVGALGSARSQNPSGQPSQSHHFLARPAETAPPSEPELFQLCQ